MADTGVKYPASVSTVQETGDDNDWVSPANVGADDAAYASITAATFDAPDTSYLLKATNFSMGVPTGAIIDGILVEIERYCDSGERCNDYDVCLTKDGSTRVGDDKSAGAIFKIGSPPAIVSFGGASDLWGTTWTVNEVNAITFGVLYKMQATDANADGYVDFIRITVYYTLGGQSYTVTPIVACKVVSDPVRPTTFNVLREAQIIASGPSQKPTNMYLNPPATLLTQSQSQRVSTITLGRPVSLLSEIFAGLQQILSLDREAGIEVHSEPALRLILTFSPEVDVEASAQEVISRLLTLGPKAEILASEIAAIGQSLTLSPEAKVLAIGQPLIGLISSILPQTEVETEIESYVEEEGGVTVIRDMKKVFLLLGIKKRG